MRYAPWLVSTVVSLSALTASPQSKAEMITYSVTGQLHLALDNGFGDVANLDGALFQVQVIAEAGLGPSSTGSGAGFVSGTYETVSATVRFTNRPSLSSETVDIEVFAIQVTNAFPPSPSTVSDHMWFMSGNDADGELNSLEFNWFGFSSILMNQDFLPGTDLAPLPIVQNNDVLDFGIFGFVFDADGNADLSDPFRGGGVWYDVSGPGLTTTTTPVPEPSSLALLCFGSLTICGAGWRRKRTTHCNT